MSKDNRLSNGVDLGVWSVPSINSLPTFNSVDSQKLIDLIKRDKISLEFFNKKPSLRKKRVPAHLLFEIND